MRLDLGCGNNCAPGFEGVDVSPLPGVKHVHDLLDFPWPFANGSAGEIHCAQLVEHLPALFWTPPFTLRNPETGVDVVASYIDHGPHQGGKARRLTPYQVNEKSIDLFLKFFDEAFRVLRPGGIMTVVCPQSHSDRAFQDPTHRRFLVPETFAYLSAKCRKDMGVEHGAYGVSCDFPYDPARIQHVYGARERELARIPKGSLVKKHRSELNVMEDMIVVLRKPDPEVDAATTQAVADAVANEVPTDEAFFVMTSRTENGGAS